MMNRPPGLQAHDEIVQSVKDWATGGLSPVRAARLMPGGASEELVVEFEAIDGGAGRLIEPVSLDEANALRADGVT